MRGRAFEDSLSPELERARASSRALRGGPSRSLSLGAVIQASQPLSSRGIPARQPKGLAAASLRKQNPGQDAARPTARMAVLRPLGRTPAMLCRVSASLANPTKKRPAELRKRCAREKIRSSRAGARLQIGPAGPYCVHSCFINSLGPLHAVREVIWLC